MNISLNEGVFNQTDKHNVNFGKKDKKNHSSAQLDSKDTTYNIPRHSLWEKTKAAARKTFLGGATAAQMATPSATTVVIPTAVVMAALQSCVEQTVDIDMSPILNKLDELMKLIGTNNEALLLELQNIRNEIQNGNMQNQQIGDAILAALDRSDAKYQEIIDLITELNAEVQKGNMTAETMLDKILKELQNIESALGKLDDLKDVIENMDKNNQEANKLLAEKIEEMISKYEQGGLSMEELMNQVISLVGDSNSISSDILEKIKELYEKYEGGGLSESELLQQIIDQLGGINDKLDQIYAQMQQDSENFNNFVEGNQANWEKLFANMDNLFNGLGSIDAKLDAIKTNGEISNDYLQKISEAVDAAVKALAEIKSEIGQTNISIGDLIDKMEQNGQKDYEPILREMLDKLGILDEINNKQFTIEQLQEALKGYKTDLSTTNELIQTAISLLEQIAGNSGSGDLGGVNEILSQLYQAVVSGNTNIDTLLKDLIAKAEQIAEDTGNINDKLDQIISKMDTQIELLTTTQNAVSTYAEQIISELQNTNADLDDIKNYSTKLDNYLDKQDGYLSKAVEYLAQLVESNGGESSYDELLAAVQAGNGTLANIESLLNDLNIKAGDFVTNESLNQALEANRTNLSTTNELIQTAISLLDRIAGNSGSGNGNIDTTQMEELLGQVLSQLANNHQATSQDLEDLKDAINDVKDALQSQNQTAMRSNSRKAGEFLKNYIAYTKMANAENARKYDDNTYYWRS